MNNKFQILLFIILTFVSCQTKENKKEISNPTTPSEQKVATEKADFIDFDKHLRVYKYDSTYIDSTLVRELWYKKDSIIKGGEKFYYTLPFESSFIRNGTIKNANGKRELVSFDSLMCETGGTSAWNKYYFEYDNQKRPTNVLHFKAWWNEGLGDLPRPKKPEYFFGEKLNYEYGNNWSKQFAYDEKEELMEMIEKRFDNQKRLVYEHLDSWNKYRFKVFYKYE